MITFVFRAQARDGYEGGAPFRRRPHVDVTVFAGEVAGSRGRAGVLTLRPEEWEALQSLVSRVDEIEVQDGGGPMFPHEAQR